MGGFSQKITSCLATGSYPVEGGRLIETFRPGGDQYNRATGLVMANPHSLGRQYEYGQTEYDAWWETYKGRVTSLSGWGEMVGTSVGMGGLMNLGQKFMWSHLLPKLVARGLTNRWQLLGVTSLILSAVVSTAMTAVNVGFRGGETASNQNFITQIFSGILYSFPSMFLGMGLMQRFGFGITLIEDAILEVGQGLLSTGIGYGLERCQLNSKSRMGFTERWRMEICEGAFFMFGGRLTGHATDFARGQPEIASPSEFGFKIVCRPLSSADSLAMMAGRKRTEPVREVQRKHIPHVKQCLKNEDPGVRLRAAEILFEAAGRFPERRSEIKSSLIQRWRWEPEGSPIKRRLLEMIRALLEVEHGPARQDGIPEVIPERRRPRSRMVGVDDDELASSVQWVLRLDRIVRGGVGRAPRLIDVAGLAADDYLNRIPPGTPRPHRSTVLKHIFDMTRDLGDEWVTRKRPEGSAPDRDLAYQAFGHAIAEARRATPEGGLRLADILPGAYQRYLQICPDPRPARGHTFSLLVIGGEENLDPRILALLDGAQVRKMERHLMDAERGVEKLRMAREEVLSGRYPKAKPMTPMGNMTVCRRARELYGDNAPSAEAFRKLLNRHPELKIGRIPRRP